MITQERLKDVFECDPERGIFIWKRYIDSRGRHCGGRVAGYDIRTKDKTYRGTSIDGKKYLLHRLMWLWVYGSFPSKEIDHIDGNSLNNSIQNLRDVSRIENIQNMRRAQKNNSVGVMGVCLHKQTGKFRSRIMVDRKVIEIGLFHNKDDAGAAYLEAKRKYHSTCSI